MFPSDKSYVKGGFSYKIRELDDKLEGVLYDKDNKMIASLEAFSVADIFAEVRMWLHLHRNIRLGETR